MARMALGAIAALGLTANEELVDGPPPLIVPGTQGVVNARWLGKSKHRYRAQPDYKRHEQPDARRARARKQRIARCRRAA